MPCSISLLASCAPTSLTAPRVRVRSSVGRFCQRLGAPQEEGSDLLGLFVSNRCDHGPFDTHHQPVGPQQSRPALAGEFAPQNAAVPRIRRTDHKVFALEIGENSLHRLRRHESGARQTCIRNAGVQFDRRERHIAELSVQADAASIHAGAERVLRAFDCVAETLRHRLRYAAAA